MGAGARVQASALLLAAALAVAALAPRAMAAEPPGGLGDAAPRRFAIVIGNGDYAVAPDLRNARADAALVGDFLASQGYAVTRYADLGKAGFEAMLRQVVTGIDKDSEVVFYYAGHGVQIGGANYLIPTDARFEGAYDLPFEAVSLTTVVDVLGARARTQIVILDSCRSNPFAGTKVLADITRVASEPRDGFNVLTAPVNSLLAFSTSPGANAYDGTAGNSPFTAALVDGARAAPERPVGQLLEEVRRRVYAITGGLQVPWESSTLVQSVSFGLPAVAVAAAPPDEAAPQASVVDAGAGAEAPILLAARLDREVGLGPSLVEALGVTPETPVSIAEPPPTGRLVVDGGGGSRIDATRAAGMTGGVLGTLSYEPAAGQPATEGIGFTVAAGGVSRAVEVSLELDPCDAEAADHLDPEGVGPGRYPNEIAPEAALPACLAAVARAPGTGRFHYQLGRVQLAMRDFAAARASFERARDLGHTRAWVALGLLVATAGEQSGGRAETPAPEEALALYRQGVAAGDPYAMHALGRELLRHGPDEETRRQGFRLLQQAVEFGHTFSMNELGAYYMNPDSPDSDPPRGLKYARESAARGDIYGDYNLGIVYRDGRAGVTPDLAAAVGWFEKAAAGGHPGAPGTLGRLWASGALAAKDAPARAIGWYDEGLARCDGWSGANAAWIIAHETPGGFLPRDAAVRAAKAAVLDDREAAAAAEKVLADLDRKAIDGGAQILVQALGGAVEIDGSFGPASQAEMQRLLAAAAIPLPESAPTPRLLALARAYWRGEPCRVDLF